MLSLGDLASCDGSDSPKYHYTGSCSPRPPDHLDTSTCLSTRPFTLSGNRIHPIITVSPSLCLPLNCLSRIFHLIESQSRRLGLFELLPHECSTGLGADTCLSFTPSSPSCQHEPRTQPELS